MPETTTITDAQQQLATILGLSRMRRDADNTGRCGEDGEWCFQLFKPDMTVAETGNAAVDVALIALRDDLLRAWQRGASAVMAAANGGLPGHAWEVEWTFDGDDAQLILTQAG